MVSYVDNKTGVRVKPPKNPVFSEAVLWFTDALGSTPTIPQADWFNMIQAELLGIAEALGVTPDKLDDNQIGTALIEKFEALIQDMPQIIDSLGDSATAAASQRIVNLVNKLAKEAMQAALQANDKANQAKQEAYEAKQIGQNAQVSADEAMDEVLANIPNSKNYESIEALEKSTKGGLAIANGENSEGRNVNNIYVNGDLRHNGKTFNPLTSQNAFTNQARFNCFGGQLVELKRRLTDVFTQKMGIVFIGDSNTWGMGTGENGINSPRSHSLKDARDIYENNSFVNIFKRYIANMYFDNKPPLLSNFHSSPTGESILTLQKEVLLFPYKEAGFDLYGLGGSQGPVLLERIDNVAGWSYRCNVHKAGMQACIDFQFTGDSFDIIYTGVTDGGTVKVYVNDTLVSSFSTLTDELVRGLRKTIKFNYEVDAKISLRPDFIENDERVSASFYLEAISINKEVIITNNGLIGVDTHSYYNKALKEGAISSYDLFCFMQFGGNDRTTSTSFHAKSITGFTMKSNLLLDELLSKGVAPILMGTSNGEIRTIDYFSRQEAANAYLNIARKRKIDYIDNCSVLSMTDYKVYAPDGSHLNVLGHSIISRNIITALESSIFQDELDKRMTSDITHIDDKKIPSTKFVHDLIESFLKK